MFPYIIGAIVLVVLALLAWRLPRHLRRRQADKRARESREASHAALLAEGKEKVQDWVDRVNAADSDAGIVAIGRFDEDSITYSAHTLYCSQDAYKQAKDKFVKAEHREKCRREDEKNAAEYSAASTLGKVHILADFIDGYARKRPEKSIGLEPDQLGGEINRLLDEVLELAMAGDVPSLFGYLGFYTEYFVGLDHQYWRPTFMSSGGQVPTFPEGWNSLVVTYIETPSIWDFQGIVRQPAPGSVRLMAAQALDERSLTLGKIVLAFCSVREDVMGEANRRDGGGKSRQAVWPYRQEIGDVLLAEVTKLVHALHAELGLFQVSTGASAPTD